MKVLYMPTYFGGIEWWRFTLPARSLKRQGIDVRYLTEAEAANCFKFHKSTADWLMEAFKGQDLVHVGYCGVPGIAKQIFEAAATNGCKIIVDIDDDILDVPTYNTGWEGFYRGSTSYRTVIAMLENAHAVTVSTSPLADKLSGINDVIQVLPNCCDPSDWDNDVDPTRGDDESVRLMFAGGKGRYGDVQVIKEPLEAIMRQYDGKAGNPMVRLFFLGAAPDWSAQWMTSDSDPLANRAFYLQSAEGVPLYNKMLQWTSPDIIASPVVTNAFNECKSHIRYLEAAMCGAAFICTDWPTYDTAPKDCALKCDNTYTQWTESLSALIEDAALRKRLSTNAREHVLATCTQDKYIDKRIEFYQSVLKGQGGMGD